jgi:DNA-directed RNA polymerase specialized sigma24 family protein
MIEPEDMKRFERHARTLGKLAGDDPAAFRQAVELVGEMEAQLRLAVLQLQDQGFSWTDIAKALGVTRQSAWKKYRVG